MADQDHDARTKPAIDALLKELAELRELDRRRQAHAPGSVAYDAATQEVDRRSRRLMDRFRDLTRPRTTAPESYDIAATRDVDARRMLDPREGSRLN